MAVVAGLSERRLAKIGGRLGLFAGEMFEGALVRSEQRRWSAAYLRGLMLEGKRKSIEPMAARLVDGDEQGLQQFVNQSPWDERVVRANLARRMCGELAPEAWIVDDTGFVKKGRCSVGVGRQYSGTLGRVDNCQIGVSVNAASDVASCPLDWRIFLPEGWDEDEQRRAKAHLPDEVRHREKWRLALDMIDELAQLGAGAAAGLCRRRLRRDHRVPPGPRRARIPYVVQIKAGTSAFPELVKPDKPEWSGRGRPPAAGYRDEPASLKQLALAAGKRAGRGVTWREGSRGRMQLALSGAARPARQPSTARRGPRVRHRAPLSAGCWSSGPQTRSSRPTTGSPACPPTPISRHSSGSPSSAGGSSTTTASSSTRSASTTSRAAPTAAGITTSPASRSHTPS